MQCPQCHTENRDGAKFCNNCGHKFEVKCTKCGSLNRFGSKFCDECGHNLASTPKSTPIDYTRPQSYTPNHLADKILTTRSSIEGERKLVTVLFADVANFTSLSEKLDPEEVHQIMDGCFKIIMDEIHRHEGTINQFTGDGVMALFGAPVAHEDHARRACHAALSIQKVLEGYGEKIEKECGIAFRMRIGLNSGHVIVGAIGDDLRMDYTAVGDTTNLAARMEGSAGPGTILASVNTHRLTKDYFEFEPLGKLEIKGKEDLQEAFRLIGAGEVATRIEASAAKGLTRFVGRKKSMAAAMAAYDKAKSGTGQVLGIVGDAGVGKSRLLLEMRNMLPPEEYTYLEGQCLHYGGSMAYLPILDILRSFFNFHEGDREYVVRKRLKEKVLELDETLEKTLPPFQELLSLKADDGSFDRLEPREKREKTSEAIRDLFVRISQDKTLILAVEDLHWIDQTSNDFLDYLIGWLANSAILLILLYRPEYTHQWASKSYYTQINLDQLNPVSSTELIKAMLEEGEVAPELKQLILTRASGNPLYMEEFTHTLLENGAIEKKENKYVLSRKASDIQVPDTIQGIIAARMDRLEENIKRTMQVASVIGRDFAFRILQTITGMRTELKSYLLNLQGLEFIYEKNLFPELEYVFKHALTQEVAYNSLLVKRRKEIHEKIGAAIEQIYAERLEEFYEMLAYHYLKSESLEKTYNYLKLSGEKLTRGFANNEAFLYYKRALKVLKKMPSTIENNQKELDLYLAMWPLMNLSGYPEDSFELLMAGKSIAQEIGDLRRIAQIHGMLGNYYFVRDGDLLESAAYAKKGYEIAEKTEDIDIIVPLGFDLQLSFFQMGDCTKAVGIANRLIQLIEKNHKENDFFGRAFNVYSDLHGVRGDSLALLGNFKEAEALIEKSADLAKKSEHLPSIALANISQSFLYAIRGDGTKAIKHGSKSVECCIEASVSLFMPIANFYLGWGHFLSGEIRIAAQYFQKALQLETEMGFQRDGPIIYTGLGTIEMEEGNYEKAQKHAEEALDWSKRINSRWFEGMAWNLLGQITGKKNPDDFEKAEEFILKGKNIFEDLKLKPLIAESYLRQGELYSDKGCKNDALKYLKNAEAMFVEMEMPYYIRKTQDVLDQL